MERNEMRWVRTSAAGVALAALLFGAGALRPISAERATASAGAPSRTAGGDAATRLASEALELLRRFRAEADPTLLPIARELLRSSLAEQPRENFAATLGMASLSNASHDFSRSVRWARRAVRIDPFDASGYGVLGDASFELGRTAAADRAYQDMIDLRPDVASYVRASYAAQSHGNVPAALHALGLAIEAAGPVGEEAAWLRHQLGDIYASQGRFRHALRENRVGTKLAPGYVPPTVGMAEALISLRRFEDALPLMERAVEDLPALEYIVTLGDLYWELGEGSAARATFADAADKLAIYRDSGVLPDADFTVFYADHRVRLEAALAEARVAYANRPTSKMADALAWISHANGRDREALGYARQALAEAPAADALQHYHAGMIAAELGHHEQAIRWLREALDLDPLFSLFHRGTARETLRALEAER